MSDLHPVDSMIRSYDTVAAEYARRMKNELDHKPFDRKQLDRFGLESGEGPVLDLGCGPGQVGAYLRNRGARVIGVDLSAGMLDAARRLAPEAPFVCADLRALPFGDGSVAGAAAFYSIIHLEPADIRRALLEVHRVLQAGGSLLLSFHVGEEQVHLDTWWEHPVDIDFRFYRASVIGDLLAEAGFSIQELTTRPPYAPEVEAQTQRCYINASKGA